MKTLKLILIIMLLKIGLLNAQYIPFPLENAQWDIVSEHYEEDPEYFSYVCKRDTVIDQIEYTIIGIENEKYGDVAVRNDIENKRVYAVYLNQLSSYMGTTDICVDEYGSSFDEDSTDYLLYDFNLQIGETIDIFFPCGLDNQNIPGFKELFFEFEIDITVGGEIRTGLFLIETETGDAIIWIQGMGTTTGPIYTNTTNYFEHNFKVECFYLNNNPLYGTCVSSIEKGEIKANILFVGNNYIKLDLSEIPTNKKTINIYDINGKLIKTLSTCTEKEKIDISKLSKGIYLVCIQNKNQILYSQKFIKQ